MHYSGSSNSKWRCLLLEGQRSYGNTSLIVRTRRHDLLHLGQMDPSAFAMRSGSKREWDQIRGRQPVDRWHDASPVDLVTLDPRRANYKNWLAVINAKHKKELTHKNDCQTARWQSWRINLFFLFFFHYKSIYYWFFFLLYIMKLFYMVSRPFVSKLRRNHHIIKIL